MGRPLASAPSRGQPAVIPRSIVRLRRRHCGSPQFTGRATDVMIPPPGERSPMQFTLRSLLAALAAAAALSAMPRLTAAQTAFPSRPITLVVPFAPGGGTDSIARDMAKNLSDRLGQPVIVENRGGAGGALGADAVAKARPDGHVLL